MTDAPPADALPHTMSVIAVPSPGGPAALVPGERPVPRPGPGEVLIRVAAAGVNRPDLLQRAGAYPPPPGAPDWPGLEVGGVIAAVGDAGGRWRVGDRACALLAGGGYAPFALADARHLLPVPDGLPLVEAAALPETLFTVWANVVEGGALKAGEWLLVHGGASGIGTTAIQLGRLVGARVLATAGSPERCRACEALGAARGIDHRAEDFVAAVMEATGGHGADVILDMVGGGYVARNYAAAAVGGRIVQIAFLEGARATLDLRPLMTKRLTHGGSTLRPRTADEKARLARAIEAGAWPFVAAGRLRPPVSATFPLREAAAAHAAMEARAPLGKIVLIADEGLAAV